jgi:hypothetical protein
MYGKDPESDSHQVAYLHHLHTRYSERYRYNPAFYVLH